MKNKFYEIKTKVDNKIKDTEGFVIKSVIDTSRWVDKNKKVLSVVTPVAIMAFGLASKYHNLDKENDVE